MIYLSCPKCRKKVIEDAPGLWRCENCCMTHDKNVPTYMISAVIADVSGQITVQFAREIGNHILDGLTASEFKNLKESQDTKEFIFNCLYK